jgi:exodeoxyribonuclease VII small subunit
MSKEITYEEALIQLKEIVSKLEMKQVKIDDLARTVKEAKQLVDFCREKLDKTESEINKIIQPEDGDEEDL